MSRKGTLFIITAPSGAGKTSLVNALITSMNDIRVSVSHTTRAQRPGEVNGTNYYFVDDNTFEQLQQKKTFLEHACVFGHQYGTSKAWVESQLKAGSDVILEIDFQGKQSITKLMSDADYVSIFILPPSIQALESRLRARAQDSNDVIIQRLNVAKQEMSHYHEFSYLVFNDEFSTALADLQAIVRSHRLLKGKQELRYQTLIQSLLN